MVVICYRYKPIDAIQASPSSSPFWLLLDVAFVFASLRDIGDWLVCQLYQSRPAGVQVACIRSHRTRMQVFDIGRECAAVSNRVGLSA